MDLAVFERDGVIGLATILLLVVTTVYAMLTWWIASSNSRIVHSQLRLIISFRVIQRQGIILSLSLGNTGRSIANNIRISIDRDFFQYADFKEERNLKNFYAFSNSIESMAPNESIIFDLAQGFNFQKEHEGKVLTPITFGIRMTYEWNGNIYDETQVIDIRPYMSSLAVPEPMEKLVSIADSLKKIASKY